VTAAASDCALSLSLSLFLSPFLLTSPFSCRLWVSNFDTFSRARFSLPFFFSPCVSARGSGRAGKQRGRREYGRSGRIGFSGPEVQRAPPSPPPRRRRPICDARAHQQRGHRRYIFFIMTIGIPILALSPSRINEPVESAMR